MRMWAADPNSRRRGAGSINTPSDCAQRNASAACPGLCSAGPFLAQIWDNHCIMQLFLNEEHHSTIPILWLLLLEGGGPEIIVNITIEKSSKLQMSFCSSMPDVFQFEKFYEKAKFSFNVFVRKTHRHKHHCIRCNFCENGGIITFLCPRL